MGVKTAIPSIYFAFTGTIWTPYDGIQFQQTASELISQGYNPIIVLLDLNFLIGYLNTTHIQPHWWTMLSQYLFGNHYFSPIFLNVLLTILIGMYTMFILSRTGFSSEYYKYFFVFFNIHWDVLAWSSFVNIKGVFITLVAVFFLYHLIMLVSSTENNRKYYHLLLLGGALSVMYLSRYYMIAILLASAITWLSIEYSSKDKIKYMIPTITFFGLFSRYGLQRVRGTRYLEGISILSFVESLPRILLTPRPWGVLPEFSFLIIPSIFHWIFFIPASMCGIWLGYRHRNLRLIFIYAIMFFIFYSLFPDLASARMRVQVVFVFTIIQYQFLEFILKRFEIKY